MVIAEKPPATADQQQLLARARKGDAEAFGLLGQACEFRLFRQAMALCRQQSMAEDLVVETLTEAWRSLPRYEGVCRFSTWLYSILLHRYQKRVHRERRQPISFSRLSPSQSEELSRDWQEAAEARHTPYQEAAQKELTRWLETAVTALPDKHRRVLLLRYFEQASLAEIAGALGCSVGTVKSRLHHALEKLRRMKTSMNLFAFKEDT